MTESAGVAGAGYSMGAAAADYDNDGLLDLFVVNYLQWSPEFDRSCGDASRQGASTAILSSSRAFPTCFLASYLRYSVPLC